MYDFIIVGQGLAGSLLAHQLMKAGQKVLILNDETLPTSSNVAAGIYNPVTGKFLEKTWLAETIFPFLEKYYAELENELNEKFFHPTKIYRPFTSIEQQNFFLSQTDVFSLENYIITEKINNAKYKSLIINDLDGLETISSGWVDIPVMLSSLREYFISQNAYLPEKYNFKDLQLTDNEIHYKNHISKKIIFSEGFYGFQNPFFSWVSHNPVKGEVLTVRINDYNLEEIVNQGIFILPLGNGLCRVGSNYIWNKLDFEITEESKLFITQKLDKLLRVPYEIVTQQAGVRPATQDRRPFLGLHPQHRNVGIFNGLGTKGVSLAPYFSNHFVEYLVNDKELLPEVNIERYYSLFS